MKARIQTDPVTRLAKVWFYDEHFGDGAIGVYRPAADGHPGSLDRTVVERGALIGEPSLVLYGDMLEALVAEASDFAQPSAAQAAHLADAVTVRDRLLTLVERQP